LARSTVLTGINRQAFVDFDLAARACQQSELRNRERKKGKKEGKSKKKRRGGEEKKNHQNSQASNCKHSR
jgi:hypothetical protein